jgi:hypothetical protein
MAHIRARIALAAAKGEAAVVADVGIYLECVTVPAAARELVFSEDELDLVGVAVAAFLCAHALHAARGPEDLLVSRLEGSQNALHEVAGIPVEVRVEPD